MNRLEVRKLQEELYAEYRKTAIRKRYVGNHEKLQAREGFAWLSPSAHNRWCFLPLRTPFSLESVMVVKAENLAHV